VKPFLYYAPRSITDASVILSEHAPDCRILAGGTDLLVEFRRPQAEVPHHLVDISRVEELSGITSDTASVTIMPLVTHSGLQESHVLKRAAPFLARAASRIGSLQIRNRGTVGGNIMNAAACADTVPPLVALNAVVTLRTAGGSRQMPLADLFVAPYKTQARPDELLVAITFSKCQPGTRTSFLKLGRRNAVSIARLSVAALVARDEKGIITEARIVTGAAFPTSRRLRGAEEMLVGEKPSGKLFRSAGKKASEILVEEVGHRWSSEYKVPVLGVLIERALVECTA
jgi:CO/xanthine dehydrogenase FAD-binding subunit